MTFKKLKETILKKAKEAKACQDEYKLAYKSKTKKQLLKVVKDNISWCYNSDVVTIELLDEFSQELCNEFGIYYKGFEEQIIDKTELVFLGDFKCEMLGNSTVNKMLGNSTVNKMWGNSTVNEMWGNSTVNEMLGNSTVNKMLGNSTVNKMLGNSTVNKMLGNSTVNEMWGNSTVNEMWDNSTVNEMFGNSTSRSYNANLPKEKGDRYCYVDLKNNKVYIGENLKLAK